MKLYEMTQEYIKLLDAISEADELTEYHFRLIDEHKDDIKEKIINVSAYIRNLESEYDAIDNAIIGMRIRSDRKRDKADRLREYLKNNMQMLNISEIQNPYFDIKIRKNPCKVNIVNADEIPKQFIKELISKAFDKSSIAQEIKNGNHVPGAELIKTNRIDIK